MSSQKHLECGSKFKKRNMPRRALKKEMDKEVSEMTKAGIIESSFSEYASSPVVVRKPDGSVRYCIDFRKLNAKSVFDAEPMPNQEVFLNRMGGDNFISRLDLTK